MQPRLEINSQRAQIEIITHRGSVEIVQRRPKLRIRRTQAQMRIERRDPTMHLNRAQVQQMLKIGTVTRTTRANNHKAIQSVINNSDGNAIMQISNNSNSLADIAVQQSINNQSTLSQSMLPPPEIQWDPGYFSVDWSSHSLDMEWDVSSWADIRVEPGYVEIRMAKHPSIVIRVKYDETEKTEGKRVDKYV